MYEEAIRRGQMLACRSMIPFEPDAPIYRPSIRIGSALCQHICSETPISLPTTDKTYRFVCLHMMREPSRSALSDAGLSLTGCKGGIQMMRYYTAPAGIARNPTGLMPPFFRCEGGERNEDCTPNIPPLGRILGRLALCS